MKYKPVLVKIMRITFLQLIITLTIAGSTWANGGKAQEILQKKISVHQYNIELESVLTRLAKDYDIKFVYSASQNDVAQKVSVSLKNTPLGEALVEVLEPLRLIYEISGDVIIIKKIPEKNAESEQDIIVTGKVTSAQDNEALPGVSVMIKGTAKGGATDVNGNYKIEVPSGSAVLVFNYVGFQKKEIIVGSERIINVQLTPAVKSLDEVVVVGFGVQKKVNLTGSVATVQGKELAERPVANAAQALQGVTPGLNITQGSGSLESRPSVNIRGTTTIGQGTNGSPLILIDGMEGDLNTINPQDIANISVLKDAASSSIYGSRAPFGVILITTKSGRTDGNATFNYNDNFRAQSPLNRRHMMSSPMFASWVNDAFTNMGQGVFFQADRFSRIMAWYNAKPYKPGQRITEDGTIVYALEPNTSGQWLGGFSTGADDVDWYDVAYKDRAFSQEHNLNVSGGTQKFSYYASGNFFDQNGFLNLGNEDLRRYNGTAKINSQLNNWLRFYYNMRFTREDYNRPSALTDNMYDNLAAKAWPVLPMYDRNGHYFYSDNTSILNLETQGQDRTQTDNSYHQLGFTLEPVKNWITHVDFNYHIKSANRHWDSQYLYNYDINGSPYPRTTNSNVHEDYYKDNYYNFNVRTEYAYSLAQRHNFHILGGFQAEDLKQTLFGLQRSGIMIPSKPEVDLTSGLDYYGTAVVPSTNGARNEWTTVGVFGRFNYDYLGKYLLEVNVRGDGSSRFRTGNQWKVFPSVSAGWNIAEENFFKPLANTVELLKLRLSYGSLGNQNTDNWYQTFQTISASSAGGSWLQKSVKTNTSSAPGLVSESLTWETIKSYNSGLDWGALNNRLDGSFDYYIRDTKNMVGNAPALPAILGTSVPVTNNTDLRTHGWELSLGWKDRLQNGLFYSARLSLSDSRTKITRYPNNPTGFTNTYIQGRYINEIWGYETVGLAKTDAEMQQHLAGLPNGGQDALGSTWTAGDIMYADLNGDGKISGGSGTITDLGDTKVIGNSTARYLFGVTLNTEWKGFDMRIFLQGVAKRDYWQGSDYFWGGSNDGVYGAVGITAVDDYFRDENTWSVQQGYRSANLNGYLPRVSFESNDKNLQVQTRYLQNAAYIRLKNLQIGYTLPARITSKWGVKQFRLFFSGENLWTGTKLASQFDPETIGTNRGNAYPLSRTLSGGLSMNF